MKELKFETHYEIKLIAKTLEDINKIRGVLEGYGFYWYNVSEIREA